MFVYVVQKYEGKFARVVAECGGSAVALYRRVVEDFVTFRDEAEFEGRTGLMVFQPLQRSVYFRGTTLWVSTLAHKPISAGRFVSEYARPQTLKGLILILKY